MKMLGLRWVNEVARELAMQNHFFKNAKTFVDGHFITTDVAVIDGQIVTIDEPNMYDLPEQDLTGLMLIPGFIDTHTHGGYGVDCNSASSDDFLTLCHEFAKTGTTSWLCSISADSTERTVHTLHEAAKAIRAQDSGAELLGIHLEGPFLAPEYHATFDIEHILPADRDLLRLYQKEGGGHIRSITIAPEIPGAIELIETCHELDIAVMLGHSGATWQETIDAAEAGAMGVTHLGNAMRPMHHREPGILGASLDLVIYTEVICDGVHLHPAFVRLAYQTQGKDGLLLVTDSMMATGLPDGKYVLGTREVEVKKGISRRSDGALAGSTLTMERAFKNLAAITEAPIADIIPCSSQNAARLLGIDSEKGFMEEGLDADLIVLGHDLHIRDVYCRGERVARI